MRSIDKLLRIAFYVKPFTEEQACILRIANA
jgi:hypothetical protein